MLIESISCTDACLVEEIEVRLGWRSVYIYFCRGMRGRDGVRQPGGSLAEYNKSKLLEENIWGGDTF
jgi:hypothetical protein